MWDSIDFQSKVTQSHGNILLLTRKKLCGSSPPVDFFTYGTVRVEHNVCTVYAMLACGTVPV